MISIARKKFSCSFLNPSSFFLQINVHDFFHSIHLFSTSRSKILIHSSKIYNLLVNKHQFSPELPAVASSRLPQIRTPEKADSVLSFLKENSFTTAQLEKIVAYNPRILGFTIESIKGRFNLFQELGLSSEDIAKLFSSNRTALHSSKADAIVSSLSILKGLMGSNHNVGRLLRKSSWFLASDLKKKLLPNVELLKSCDIPMELIRHFLYVRPWCLLIKPAIMRKSIDKAIELRVSRSSVVFITAVEVFAWTSEGMWEVKMQTFRDLGFSDDDVFEMFRKQPLALIISCKKIKSVVELLLATEKYDISSIVRNPSSLGCSIERRLGPRLHILGVLESRNLIEDWPGLPSLSQYNDATFFDRFVRPYIDEIGQEYITKWRDGVILMELVCSSNAEKHVKLLVSEGVYVSRNKSSYTGRKEFMLDTK